MHPHLTNWFLNLHIHSDSKTIEQRWKTAKEYAKKLKRENVILLLRLFLHDNPNPTSAKIFTDELNGLDKEFPVENNTGELRLMAGIVMVTTFTGSSYIADAFALGLQAADFPKGRGRPAQPAILAEAQKYLLEEAERQRPADFDIEPPNIEDRLLSEQNSTVEAEATGDATKISDARIAYNKAIAKGIEESCRHLSGQIRRLAEETALLWWVVSGSSITLKRRTEKLAATEFALIAAAEAAQRTQILPPPVSICALLVRALAPCRAGAKKNLTIQDFLDATDGGFRAEQVGNLNFADCGDLVPITTALAKSQEFGEGASAVKVLPNLCPGFKTDHSMSPVEAALQYYNELMFLKALVALNI